MDLIVRLTPRAVGDLEDIRDYLSQRSMGGAEDVRQQIDAVLQRLKHLPMLGITTSEASIRVVQLVRYPYRIFYVVRQDAIDVVHIRHTSRQPITPSDT